MATSRTQYLVTVGESASPAAGPRAGRRRSPARRWLAVLATTALIGSLLGVVGTVAQGVAPAGSPLAAPTAAASPSFESLGYTALPEPCRAVDTRIAGGTIGPGVTRDFQMRGTTSLAAQGGSTTGCNVPSAAEAVEISVTAVSPSGANGFMRAFPAGSSVNAAFLNYTVGRGITNTGTVPIDNSVTLDLGIANFGGTVHLIVDVQGYFVPTVGASYVPLSVPCKAVDTRTAGGTIAAGGNRPFQIGGLGVDLTAQGGPFFGCGVPDDAPGVEVAVTVIAPVGTGFARVAPNTLGPIPRSAFINYTNGTGITNTGSVTLASADPRDLIVESLGGTVHVRIDVQGYYTTSGTEGSRYQTVAPCRTVDTRNAGGPIGPSVTRTFQTGGPVADLIAQGTGNTYCGVPQRAAAVEASITAVSPVGTGFTQVAPAGSLPAATVLNYSPVGGITNTGTLPLSVTGLADIGIRNLGGSAAYLVDVLGYYEPLPDWPRSGEVIDAGSDHTCQVVGGGQVRCWGENTAGELGDGSTNDSGVPLTVPGLDGAIMVAVGNDHTCALADTGDVRCWGSNFDGQLGTGDRLDRRVPTSLPTGSLATQIVAGGDHTCALLVDRTVSCWGRNDSGQLGDGTTISRPVPTAVPGLSSVVRLAASPFHTCAQLADATARCWGANGAGEVGDGTTTRRTSPVAVSGLTGVIELDVGPEHSCALRSDGAARCWGLNGSGQLGDGTLLQRLTPVAVTGLTGAVDITVGGVHTCAALADGSARCWGGNSVAQLGDGSTTARSTPTPVSLGASRVVELTAGTGHTCALVIEDGFRDVPATECWGDAAVGSAGYAALPFVSEPTALIGSYGSVAVATGGGHSCGLGVDGLVSCWGSNANGQVGRGFVGGLENMAGIVDGIDGVIQVVAGANHTCALRFDQTVWCWGSDAIGELGDGAPVGDSGTPVQVVSADGPILGVVELAAGFNHTCARDASGSVGCWGYNFFGQLGDGSRDNRSVLVATPGITDAVGLVAGGDHTCVRTASDGVRCWGSNTSGQLGSPTSLSLSVTPIAVTGLSDAITLSAGGSTTCAVLTNARPRCWGLNDRGQLGTGNTISLTSPTAVSGLDGLATQVDLGGAHTCAIVSTPPDVQARCWGANNLGQLGRDSISGLQASPGPVLEASLSPLFLVTHIDAGAEHTCAVAGGVAASTPWIGQISCWGRNDSGQLGDGTFDPRLTATRVVST